MNRPQAKTGIALAWLWPLQHSAGESIIPGSRLTTLMTQETYEYVTTRVSIRVRVSVRVVLIALNETALIP